MKPLPIYGVKEIKKPLIFLKQYQWLICKMFIQEHSATGGDAGT
jgi:hypothetical protein